MSTVWHTDVLQEFNHQLYKDVLTKSDVISKEVCKKYEGVEYFGYELERFENRYFLKSEFIQDLPIRMSKGVKFSHSGSVYTFILGLESIKIPAQPKMNIRQLLDSVGNYAHGESLDWFFYRLLCVVAYVDRVNVRVASPASFGKDGIVDILACLMSDVSNLYNATLGKLKYSLRNNLIVLNELGNLNKQEASDMQIFLMQAGAYKPLYENNSRMTSGTKEVIDISGKSFLVIHNTPDYYEEKGQAFFEQLFTKAVHDRFPCFLFKGVVLEDFGKVFDKKQLAMDHASLFKNVISSLNYYRQHPVKDFKYSFNSEFWGFKGKKLQRSLRTFNTLAKWLSHYSKDEDEFILLCSELLKRHEDYEKLINPAVMGQQEIKITEEEVK